MNVPRGKVSAALALLVGVGASTAVLLPEATAEPAPVRAAASLSLEVDLSERTLYVHNNGEVIQTYDVAVGTSDHPTPKGSFTIGKIIWDPAWVPPPNAEWAEGETRKAPDDPDNPMHAVKMFFDEPDYYIHGTGALESLGEAASHGCLRMDPSDAENLAILVQRHGGEWRSTEWFKEVIRQEAESHEVALPDPVPLEVHS